MHLKLHTATHFKAKEPPTVADSEEVPFYVLIAPSRVPRMEMLFLFFFCFLECVDAYRVKGGVAAIEKLILLTPAFLQSRTLVDPNSNLSPLPAP